MLLSEYSYFIIFIVFFYKSIIKPYLKYRSEIKRKKLHAYYKSCIPKEVFDKLWDDTLKFLKENKLTENDVVYYGECFADELSGWYVKDYLVYIIPKSNYIPEYDIHTKQKGRVSYTNVSGYKRSDVKNIIKKKDYFG